MSPAKSSPSTGDRPVAFVISPIGAQGSELYDRFKLSLDYIIKKALEPKWRVVRADEESAPDSITGQVIRRIYESELIVADMSGHNPNVFYEIAVAHGYRRPVIHLMEDGQKVPFDLGDQRAIFYDLTNPASVATAISRLSRAADHAGKPDYDARNPLTQYEQFAAIKSATGADEAGAAVADALAQLSGQVALLSRRVSELDDRRSPRGAIAAVAAARELNDLEAELAHVEKQMQRRLTETDGDASDDALYSELRHRRNLLMHRRSRAEHHVTLAGGS